MRAALAYCTAVLVRPRWLRAASPAGFIAGQPAHPTEARSTGHRYDLRRNRNGSLRGSGVCL
jgi:hypothetical protein